jgi:hypothetical protein
MKILTLIIILVFSPVLLLAQTYQIDWYVIGSGGGHSASGSYQLDGTIGQPIVGKSSSSNYSLDAGFWVGASATGPVCDYTVGDANGSHSFNGLDVTYSVGYFKGGPIPPYTCECTPGHIWYVAGDVNASCSFNGLDVTYMVSYFKGGPGVHPCGDCPPGGMLAPPIPGIEPIPAVQPVLNSELNVKPAADGKE